MACKVKRNPYAFPAPIFDIEEDVISPFSAIAQRLGNHHIILGQPLLQLLVKAPIPVVTKYNFISSCQKKCEEVVLQFLGCCNLVRVSGIAVEHEYQGLVVEILDLRVQRSNVMYSIALR